MYKLMEGNTVIDQDIATLAEAQEAASFHLLHSMEPDNVVSIVDDNGQVEATIKLSLEYTYKRTPTKLADESRKHMNKLTQRDYDELMGG